jgi:hypothetical protein
MEIYVGFAVAVTVAAVLIYVKRIWFYEFLKNMRHEILISFGIRELASVIFLTGLYMFLSFTFFMRIGRDEVMIFGFPRIVTFRYYGKPFEMISVLASSVGGGGESEEGWGFTTTGYSGTTNVLLPGLLLNTAVFSLLAFLTVYVGLKLKYLSEYARSSDAQRKIEGEE